MRRTGVSKTCEFPRRNAVFLQKWPSRAGKEGGPGGRRQRRDVSRRGQKTPKTGEKCPVLRLRPVNSHIKLQFLFTRRSGRTLRTRFPPPGSAIFRSEARPVDAKRCRSGRALRNASRSLAVMVRQKNQKKKEKNKF